MADDLVEDLLCRVRPTPLERLAGLADPTGPIGKRIKDYDELTAILAKTGKQLDADRRLRRAATLGLLAAGHMLISERTYPSDLWIPPTPLERLAALAEPNGRLAERVRAYDTIQETTRVGGLIVKKMPHPPEKTADAQA